MPGTGLGVGQGSSRGSEQLSEGRMCYLDGFDGSTGEYMCQSFSAFCVHAVHSRLHLNKIVTETELTGF